MDTLSHINSVASRLKDEEHKRPIARWRDCGESQWKGEWRHVQFTIKEFDNANLPEKFEIFIGVGGLRPMIYQNTVTFEQATEFCNNVCRELMATDGKELGRLTMDFVTGYSDWASDHMFLRNLWIDDPEEGWCLVSVPRTDEAGAELGGDRLDHDRMRTASSYASKEQTVRHYFADVHGVLLSKEELHTVIASVPYMRYVLNKKAE